MPQLMAQKAMDEHPFSFASFKHSLQGIRGRMSVRMAQAACAGPRSVVRMHDPWFCFDIILRTPMPTAGHCSEACSSLLMAGLQQALRLLIGVVRIHRSHCVDDILGRQLCSPAQATVPSALQH